MMSRVYLGQSLKCLTNVPWNVNIFNHSGIQNLCNVDNIGFYFFACKNEVYFHRKPKKLGNTVINVALNGYPTEKIVVITAFTVRHNNYNELILCNNGRLY